MNKKAIAVAVAGALGGLTMPVAAWAQTSTVQIGGSITVFYYNSDINNGSVGQSGDILETSEPEMFIRGEEKLGGDLSAWFQCTTSLDGIVTGAATAFGLCGRNSGIGFKGGWGNIFAGNWDVPHKLVFNRVRGAFGGTNPLTGGSAVVLAGGSASGLTNAVPVLVPGGSATSIAGQASFFRRQAASWTYHSPVWSGFQLQGAFSAANEQTGNPEISPMKQRMWSVAAHYDNGPLYLGAAYERHSDYNPGLRVVNVGAVLAPGCVGAGAVGCYSGGDDDGYILAAGYTFGGKFKLTGAYTSNEYETGPGQSLKAKGWMFFGDWNIVGPHTVRAGVAVLKDTSGSSTVSVGSYTSPGRGLACGATSTSFCGGDTGAVWWNIHYEYAFSKRTAVLVAYNKMDNDGNARFSLGKAAPTIGASQENFGIGIKHRF